MNKELIRSWTFKILPIIMAFVVGKGWVSQADSDAVVPLIDKIWGIVDEILLAAASAVTLIRSIRTHKAADGIPS
jgi:hypothetical protein